MNRQNNNLGKCVKRNIIAICQHYSKLQTVTYIIKLPLKTSQHDADVKFLHYPFTMWRRHWIKL